MAVQRSAVLSGWRTNRLKMAYRVGIRVNGRNSRGGGEPAHGGTMQHGEHALRVINYSAASQNSL